MGTRLGPVLADDAAGRVDRWRSLSDSADSGACPSLDLPAWILRRRGGFVTCNKRSPAPVAACRMLASSSVRIVEQRWVGGNRSRSGRHRPGGHGICRYHRFPCVWLGLLGFCRAVQRSHSYRRQHEGRRVNRKAKACGLPISLFLMYSPDSAY